MVSPLMHRCSLCEQDWWDAHVCPHLSKPRPPLSPDSVVAIEGHDFQRKRADEAQARLSKAIKLLKAARPAVLEMAVGFGAPDEAQLVDAIDSFLQGEGK